MQNAEGGGSIAVTRKTYFEIGGFDESFVGWGGEHNEFWERAMTRSVWPYGYMPLVHLWHTPQTERNDSERGTAALLEAKSAIPVEERIKELSARILANPNSLDEYSGQAQSNTPMHASKEMREPGLCAE